jgi:hypothetical protein
VPSQCSALGGWRTLAKSATSKSYGASTGAKIPIKMNMATSIAPKMAPGLRERRRSVMLRFERGARKATSLPDLAGIEPEDAVIV